MCPNKHCVLVAEKNYYVTDSFTRMLKLVAAAAPTVCRKKPFITTKVQRRWLMANEVPCLTFLDLSVLPN